FLTAFGDKCRSAFSTEVGMFSRRAANRCLAAIAGMALILFSAVAPAWADAGFQRWVAEFRSVAAANGISTSTYDRAFRGVTAADPEVLEKARYQPEFKAPAWQYFDNRVHEEAVATGRA